MTQKLTGTERDALLKAIQKIEELAKHYADESDGKYQYAGRAVDPKARLTGYLQIEAVANNAQAVLQTAQPTELPTVERHAYRKIIGYELRETESNDVQTLYGLFEMYEDNVCRFVCEFDYFDIELGKKARDAMIATLAQPASDLVERIGNLRRKIEYNHSNEYSKSDFDEKYNEAIDDVLEIINGK